MPFEGDGLIRARKRKEICGRSKEQGEQTKGERNRENITVKEGRGNQKGREMKNNVEDGKEKLKNEEGAKNCCMKLGSALALLL